MDFLKARDIAKKVINGGEKNITLEEKKYAATAYTKITGKPWRGCNGCWSQLYLQINAELQQIQISNQKNKMAQFKLKPGKLIQVHGFDVIGEKNMTDEKALNLLRIHRGHIKNFAVYPENWEILVANHKAIPVKSSPSLPKTSETPIPTPVQPEPPATPAPSSNQAKENLEGLSKAELKAICATKNFQKKEYDKLNKDNLVEYLLSKL